MMDEENVVLMIRDYVYDTYGVPCNYYTYGKSHLFSKNCYMRWAADELIEYIHRYSGDAYTAIKHFRANMLDYSKRNKMNRMIFESAAQLATSILNICDAAGWNI